MEEFIRRSKLTGQKYNVFDRSLIRIKNLTQAMAYLSNDALPLDIYVGNDEKKNKPCLVFVYKKDDIKEEYDSWCKYELEIKATKDFPE